ncbi:MAG: energy transducer TonB [Betaproteobacteria bacterium]|nr:energy transducer TonB [Betaproteobacteria bacterium]
MRRLLACLLAALALHLAVLALPFPPVADVREAAVATAMNARLQPTVAPLAAPAHMVAAAATERPAAARPRASNPVARPPVAEAASVAAPVVPAVPAAVVEPAGAPVATAFTAAPAPRMPGTPSTPARYDAAYLNNPSPGYPAASRRLGEEGRVLLRVRVGADGRPLSVDLEKGSNFSRLDEAARDAVTRWRFVPARRGDEAVEGSVLVPLVFRLDQ